MCKITVVSLGYGDETQLTEAARKELLNASSIIFRTKHHDVAEFLTTNGVIYDTLDHLYESCHDFSELILKTVELLLKRSEAEPVCYGVFEAVYDETVSALVQKAKEKITIIPGVSVSAVFLSSSCISIPNGLITIPAISIHNENLNPRKALLVTELNSRIMTGEVKLRLLSLYKPDMKVLFSHRSVISPILLEDLDRQSIYDHTSLVFLPDVPLLLRNRYDFQDLVDIMSVLRGERGCPWDLKQTHDSLCQYLIEEAYETVSAISKGDAEAIYDELGDVLLQVVFHANIAQQYGTFDITDVTSAIVAKMISRHRHIFGDKICETPERVIASWEEIKKAEKGLQDYSELMDDIPKSLPALIRASKVQAKAAQVGFDFVSAGDALNKVAEEMNELNDEIALGTTPDEELGDLLFSCVNVARKLKIQPELCLMAATEKFIRRFKHMESKIILSGKTFEDLTLAEMDVYWESEKGTLDT